MAKISVVTDSTAYLPKDIVTKYDIKVVPLAVNLGEKTYLEGIDMTTEEFYKYMQEEEELPTTSQPAIGDFVQTYEKIRQEGSKEAIAIHLSSGISGTMNTSMVASEMVDGLNVEVVDSEIACYGLGFMVIEAAEMSKKDKELAEIKERVEYIVENMRGYFIVDDLAHLHRGGRLNAAQFLVGSMLKIKPIIHFKNKKLEPFEKIRTKKKAVDRILQLLDQDAKDGASIKCSVVQANIYDEAVEVAERIKKVYPNVEVNISDFGPVIGTHTGPGTIGLVWYKV
jgi:DegV family protein with EDD domain